MNNRTVDPGRALAVRLVILILAAGGVLTALGGCQIAQDVSVKRLAIHRQTISDDGLQSPEAFEALRVSWAVPQRWEALPIKSTSLYTHQQWRSPSTFTGVGVAYIDLPLPMPAQALVWLAKNEYLRRTRDQKDGKLIGQWTDSLGRQWFEASNSKYHVFGYAMTRGDKAWIVYSGWRTAHEPQPEEIAIARRSLESVVPTR